MNLVTPPENTPEETALTGADLDAKFDEVAENQRREMETLALRLKDLVLSQPPQELLGYLWAGLLMASTEESAPDSEDAAQNRRHKDVVFFAMEYVHAILSCFDATQQPTNRLREDAAAEILAVAGKLREAAVLYCITSSRPRSDAEFGDETAHVEVNAKTQWVIIRGNRYPVLEGEFFLFVLGPHDEALRRAYGIGTDEAAAGIQAIADATRLGFARAIQDIEQGMDAVSRIADEAGLSPEQALQKLAKESPELIESVVGSYMDLGWGGLCNVSRHTSLPAAFLEDLSFERGENTEFFEAGPFAGTPLRTLPARVKPLVHLDDGFYSTDPFWVRDAAYRAIHRGLVTRLPEYREEWNRKQKALSETAFQRILRDQLSGASVLTDVWYRDPASCDWVETDALVLLDDVLLEIEAKARTGAMHSPATSFESHVRAIQRLVVDAYRQADRFFHYLASEPEVPLFELRDGEYVELRRLRLADYRVAIPIGLTVESFTPFSAMCKELPEIAPILDRYPFVSMSIDDLFVLNRLLPTTGELFHYLEVRQQVAGIRRAFVFDELDHLGAYIAKNRFDMDLRKQLADRADVVLCTELSNNVDRYFQKDDWTHEPPPHQEYPDELAHLLNALEKTRAPGWLRMDSLIRDFGSDARSRLAGLIKEWSGSLSRYIRRYFVFGIESPLLVWLHRANMYLDQNRLIRKAEVVALSTERAEISVLRISVGSEGDFTEARGFVVQAPTVARHDYWDLMSEARALRRRMKAREPASVIGRSKTSQKPRPNELCWCGSGRKFKRCHGRR